MTFYLLSLEPYHDNSTLCPQLFNSIEDAEKVMCELYPPLNCDRECAYIYEVIDTIRLIKVYSSSETNYKSWLESDWRPDENPLSPHH